MSWTDISLGELFSVGSSKRVLKTQWQTSGVPFYRGREITTLATRGNVDNELFITEELFSEFREKYGVPEAGDIVVTAIGTIGNSYIVKPADRFYFKDASVLWLAKKSDINSNFVNYWLQSAHFKRQLDKGNGATVDTLTIRKLKSARIPLPPLSKQERIVAILDEAVAGIDTAIANTEKNLANARELFESYLDAVFSQRGEEWAVATLDQICVIARGGSPRPIKAYLTDASDGVNWIKIADATASSKFIYQTKQKIRPEGVKRSRMVYPGDLLLSNSMSFGRPYIMKTSGCIHDGWLVLSNKTNSYETNYLYYFLGSSEAYRQFDLRASGSTVRNLNIELVRSVQVPIPPLPEQARIAAKVEELEAEAQRIESIYQQKLAALAELKQSILERAFSGELTADAADAQETAIAALP